jgi:hypothetical protein
MTLTELLILLAGILVIAAMVLVVRVNRKDEKDVWRGPDGDGHREHRGW